jgi:hypothetical protein
VMRIEIDDQTIEKMLPLLRRSSDEDVVEVCNRIKDYLDGRCDAWWIPGALCAPGDTSPRVRTRCYLPSGHFPATEHSFTAPEKP